MQRREEIEQARLIKWTHKRSVRELMPALQWLHHSPNGGARNGFTGGQMKALGVKKGFPDLILPVRSRGRMLANWLGLVIEMKYGDGAATDEQVAWLQHYDEQGWFVRTCWSAEHARTTLCEYFGIPIDAAPALDD